MGKNCRFLLDFVTGDTCGNLKIAIIAYNVYVDIVVRIICGV